MKSLAEIREAMSALYKGAASHEGGWAIACGALVDYIRAIDALTKEAKPRPLSEWHEDMGDQLWWKFPIEEAPYCGSPLDLGMTVQFDMDIAMRTHVDPQGEQATFTCRRDVGGWPGYHTHFTPIPMPEQP